MRPKQRATLILFYLLSWVVICTPVPTSAKATPVTDSLARALLVQMPDTARIEILLRLSAIYQADSPSVSYFYGNDALYLSEKNKWQRGITAAELRVAVCYVEVWELQEAIRHLHKSIAAARTVGDVGTERVCWQYLVHCYDHLGDHQKALDCQERLMTMIWKTGDTAAICRQMSALATCTFDAGRQQEGINILKQDIDIASTHLHGYDRNDISAELLNTLSTVYVRVGKTDSALYCLRKALPMALAINDTPNFAYIYSSFCDAYYHARVYDSAEYYAKKTLSLGERFNDLLLLKAYYGILANIYEKNGQPAMALRNFKITDSIAALITRSERTLERSMQVSRVAIAQQQAHRQQEKRRLESINAGQKRLLAVVIGVLVAIAIIACLVFRNLRVKENKNKIIQAQAQSLQEQNELIDTALKDKEVLLQEMHHRVKNNLQLINSLLELQISQLGDKDSADALMAAQQRIYSMAMVHSRLYHHSGEASVEIHDFASDLFQSLAKAFNGAGKEVRFQDNIAEVHLPLNMLVPIGLILNELITNSFKHAFRGVGSPVITMDLEEKGNSIVLTYSDNGKGISDMLPQGQSGTLGIYLIRRLTRQLNGEIVYSNESGSKFTFTFPYERDHDRHS